jgi:hypothetical protein
MSFGTYPSVASISGDFGPLAPLIAPVVLGLRTVTIRGMATSGRGGDLRRWAVIALGVVVFAVRTKLARGVYVEEVSSGSRPIEAVGTAVAAFVGLAP